MDSFIIFAENTKRDFFLIAGGFVMISISTFMKPFFGYGFSTLLKIIGIILISVAVVVLVTQLKLFFAVNPNFLTDYQYEPYRKNIYAGCGVSLILLALICYATYTVFFN